MAARDTERTGVLVVRAWLETGGLRARVTRTLDISLRDETVSVTSSPEEITRIVIEWLDAFIAESLEGDGAVTPR